MQFDLFEFVFYGVHLKIYQKFVYNLFRVLGLLLVVFIDSVNHLLLIAWSIKSLPKRIMLSLFLLFSSVFPGFAKRRWDSTTPCAFDEVIEGLWEFFWLCYKYTDSSCLCFFCIFCLCSLKTPFLLLIVFEVI